MSSRAVTADAATGTLAVRPDTFASLRIRNFRLFAAGLFVSGAGGWAQRIAQDWLVLDLTGSATAVGVTTTCQFLPTLVIGLFGGVIADRYPRRTVLLVTQLAFGTIAGLLAMLTFSGRATAWPVYALALALGIVTACANPCRQAFVNELVGPDRVRNGIALVSSTIQLGALLGPVLAGALIGVAGSAATFAFAAATYAVSVGTLLLVDSDDLRNGRGQPPVSGVRIRDGLRHVVRHPRVRWPLLLVGTFGMFILSLPVILVTFADSVLHSGAGGYGLLTSVVGAGALTGALLAARRVRRGRLRTLVATAAALAVATMLAGLAPNAWAFLPLLVALGVVNLLFMTAAQAMVQQTTPDALRGRVLGMFTLVFIGGGGLGAPLVGWIAEHAGPRGSLLVAGAVPAAVTLLVARKLANDGHLRLRVRYQLSVSLVRR